ncbi:MAG: hypothetical protein KJ058_04600 [Thermoanaerobaculia bacterium]|nr:hypothetical protein [Thermoanaerobaculia bacterium]
MNRIVLACLTLLLLASAGCVKKSDYDALAADLATARQELEETRGVLVQKEADLAACNTQWQEAMKAFGGEHARTQDVIAGVKEWKLQVEQKLPAQVRAEVEAQLNTLVRQLEAGFGALATENAKMAEALERQNEAINTVATNVSGAREDLISEVTALRTEREAVGAKVNEVIALVQEWDQSRMLCKDCEDKLRLNKKEVEAITGLHAELVQRLAELK